MFTGIVTDVGEVVSAEQRGDLRLHVKTAYDLTTVDLGASIACSGVCLTVVDKGHDWFAVDVSAETISRTAAEMWREGARLNLERPLRMGDELGEGARRDRRVVGLRRRVPVRVVEHRQGP